MTFSAKLQVRNYVKPVWWFCLEDKVCPTLFLFCRFVKNLRTQKEGWVAAANLLSLISESKSSQSLSSSGTERRTLQTLSKMTLSINKSASLQTSASQKLTVSFSWLLFIKPGSFLYFAYKKSVWYSCRSLDLHAVTKIDHWTDLNGMWQQRAATTHRNDCFFRRKALLKRRFRGYQWLWIMWFLSCRWQRLWEPEHVFQLQRDLHQLLWHQTLISSFFLCVCSWCLLGGEGGRGGIYLAPAQGQNRRQMKDTNGKTHDLLCMSLDTQNFVVRSASPKTKKMSFWIRTLWQNSVFFHLVMSVLCHTAVM